jgi:hypothetical protein
MATINFGSNISLAQFTDAIATVGEDVTIIGQGEPGIGKSAILKDLAKRFPNHIIAYIDCTLLDLGDFALPYTVEENGMRVTKFAPNARFLMHMGKPVVIMLDEIGKAMKSVKNVLLTLMNEHRIGDVHLPNFGPGMNSIVFGTTNLASDGVGDSLEAHALNRVCRVTVRKPHAGFQPDGSIDSDSWGMWAINNDIAPEVIAAVKQFPDFLESYTDAGQRDNPYIFNPMKGQTAFVSPRSLEKASHIAKKRHILGDAVTISLLSGVIGESAARHMEAFFTVVDKLPTWEAIVKDPMNAKLPSATDAVAKCLLVFSALARVDASSLEKWLHYLQRMDMEWQALFAKSAMKSTAKQGLVVNSTKFKAWAMANAWIF